MLTLDPKAFDVAAALSALATDGYARLGPVIDDASRLALGRRLDDIMTGAVKYDDMFFQHDSPTGLYDDLEYGRGWIGPSSRYRKVERLEKDPLFRAWMENPLFERIARAGIEGPVVLYRALVFTKAAHGGTMLPFHQDGGAFWGVDRPPTLQIWTALDDCTRDSGCLEIVPGTHVRGLVTPEGGVVQPEALAKERAEERAIPIEVRAGESLLIHNHVWHRSGVNHTDVRRSAFSFCLMSAETRCMRKKRAPREFVRLYESKRAD